MPRAGSPQSPPGGPVPAAPMDIGEVANPQFAVLPDPTTVFLTRAARFEAIAAGHDLEPYLRFLAGLCRAQHDCQVALPAPALPPAELLDRRFEHGMPPLPVAEFEADPALDATLSAFAAKLAGLDMPEATRRALDLISAANADGRRALVEAALTDQVGQDGLATHVLVTAALQVHLTRAAALLDAERLTRVSDGVCPACGSAAVASRVVDWKGASHTRYCCCSLCSTQWHVVRIRCLLCGSDKGITYHHVEGGAETLKAETCTDCRAYVKIFHQHKDAALEPFADDVGSLGLDLLLRDQGWTRASVNPFLFGY